VLVVVFRNRLKAPRQLASNLLGWHHDRVRALLGKVSEAVSIDGNKAVAKKLFGAVFNNRRVELVDELVADDVVDHNRLIFAQPEGPGGVVEGIRMLLAAFPDMSAAVERLVGEADCVVVKVRMAGTNTGPYPRVPEPTEQHAEWNSMVLLRIEDGKIAELWGISDRMGMLTQLGILPDIG
jgi:predicted ester cyclase